MAKANLTKRANIDVSIREIDFVSRFAKNFEALREILGISRPIRKESGTRLTAKVAQVTLQSGLVGEGEEIPYSLAQVNERDMGDIIIEKYAKAVSLEAVSKYGAEVAVQKTDDAFLAQLQNNVTDKMYSYLKQGTLVSYEPTFQSALSMAKGNVVNLWKSMNLDITEVVAFVNVKDFFRYLGSTGINLQRSFGMDYIRDFLGYSVIFLADDTRIPSGTVIATPVENIVAYYVDPADSDFARLGLNYTVDGETNLIGFHVNGNYNTAVGENFAIMGLHLFAEYLNGIAVITIGEAPTTTLTVASDPATSVLGKNVADLQSNIVVKDNALLGTVKYVTGFTGYSGDPELQQGYYLALKATPSMGATVTAELIGGNSGPVTLDEDLEALFRLTEGCQSIEFTATLNNDKVVKRYDITKLIRA